MTQNDAYQVDVWPVACGYQKGLLVPRVAGSTARERRASTKRAKWLSGARDGRTLARRANIATSRTAVDLVIADVKDGHEILWWPVPKAAKPGDVLLFRLREHLRVVPVDGRDPSKVYPFEVLRTYGTWPEGFVFTSISPQVLGGSDPPQSDSKWVARARAATDAGRWVCGARGYQGLVLIVERPTQNVRAREMIYEAPVSDIVFFKKPVGKYELAAWPRLVAFQEDANLPLCKFKDWRSGDADRELMKRHEAGQIREVATLPEAEGAKVIESLRAYVDDGNALENLLDRSRMLKAGMPSALTREVVRLRSPLMPRPGARVPQPKLLWIDDDELSPLRVSIQLSDARSVGMHPRAFVEGQLTMCCHEHPADRTLQAGVYLHLLFMHRSESDHIDLWLHDTFRGGSDDTVDWTEPRAGGPTDVVGGTGGSADTTVHQAHLTVPGSVRNPKPRIVPAWILDRGSASDPVRWIAAIDPGRRWEGRVVIWLVREWARSWATFRDSWERPPDRSMLDQAERERSGGDQKSTTISDIDKARSTVMGLYTEIADQASWLAGLDQRRVALEGTVERIQPVYTGARTESGALGVPPIVRSRTQEAMMAPAMRPLREERAILEKFNVVGTKKGATYYVDAAAHVSRALSKTRDVQRGVVAAGAASLLVAAVALYAALAAIPGTHSLVAPSLSALSLTLVVIYAIAIAALVSARLAMSNGGRRTPENGSDDKRREPMQHVKKWLQWPWRARGGDDDDSNDDSNGDLSEGRLGRVGQPVWRRCAITLFGIGCIFAIVALASSELRWFGLEKYGWLLFAVAALCGGAAAVIALKNARLDHDGP